MDDPTTGAAEPQLIEALAGGMPRDLLVRILIGAEALDSIVVGGQALNLWGERYLDRAPSELVEFTPFQSKDIDFHGDATVAAELAQLLDGDLRIPSGEDVVTPNSAAVDVHLRGRCYTIDFLHSVAGLDVYDMLQRAQILSVPLPDGDGTVRPTEVRVLHPVDVLRSRIAGVTVLRRRDAGALRQLAAAPILLREFIRDLLDMSQEGDAEAIGDAQDAVREFIAIGGSPDNDIIISQHGIDLLAHAARLATHNAWHPLFAEHQIRAACAAAAEKRKRRTDEASRRLARQGT